MVYFFRVRMGSQTDICKCRRKIHLARRNVNVFWIGLKHLKDTLLLFPTVVKLAKSFERKVQKLTLKSFDEDQQSGCFQEKS